MDEPALPLAFPATAPTAAISDLVHFGRSTPTFSMQTTYVLVNNRTEGNAPLTTQTLMHTLMQTESQGASALQGS